MSKGYVYILSNPSMPGIVKIGKTTRTIEARAQELYQTGVPTPFEVAHCVFSPDCSELERDTHDRLADKRVSPNREFFAIGPKQAAQILDRQHMEQVHLWLDEFVPEYTVVPLDLCVDEGFVRHMAYELDAPAPDIASAISFMTPAEIKPFLASWYDRINSASRRVEEGMH